MVPSLLLGALLPAQPVRAVGTVQLGLGPSSQNVSTGSTFQVALNLTTSGQAVDTVSAALTYPSNRLSCQSVTTTNDFAFTPQPDVCSGGNILIQRGRGSNYTANGVVAIVTFKALLAGSAHIHLENTSVVLTGGDNVPYTTVDGDYWAVNGPISYTWSLAGQAAYTDASKSTGRNLGTMMTGQTAWLVLQARNTGNATWSKAGLNPVRLGAEGPRDRASRFATPAWLGPNRPTELVEASVAPGAVGSFEFPITVPPGGGNFFERFNLVAEGVTWMNDIGLGYSITVSPPSYTWSLAAQAAYTDASKSSGVDLGRLSPGESAWLVLQARNTGNVTWSKAGANPVRVGNEGPKDRASRFRTGDWLAPGRPAALNEASVVPGAVGSFEFPITVPPGGGNFFERFNLLAEGITWMNDLGLGYSMHVGGAYSWALAGQYAYSDASKTVGADLTQLSPGQTVFIGFKARNTGDATWYNTGPYPLDVTTTNPTDRCSLFVSAGWLGCQRPGRLVEMSVAPGAIGTFEFNYTAPNTPKTYNEYFNLVAEGIVHLNNIGMNFSTVVR